jgi:hypothetical protein
MSNSTGTITTAEAGEYRGNILLGCTLGFGIAAFLFVTLRLGFRASRRAIGPSDWCIGIAVARDLRNLLDLSIYRRLRFLVLSRMIMASFLT